MDVSALQKIYNKNMMPLSSNPQPRILLCGTPRLWREMLGHVLQAQLGAQTVSNVPEPASPYATSSAGTFDWLVWFLPFSVRVTERGILVPGYEIWFLRLILKLLEDDRATLKLLGSNPFNLAIAPTTAAPIIPRTTAHSVIARESSVTLIQPRFSSSS